MRRHEAHQDEVFDRFEAKIFHHDECGSLFTGPLREVVKVVLPDKGLGAVLHASEIQSGLYPPDIVFCKRCAARGDLVKILAGYCRMPRVEALGYSLDLKDMNVGRQAFVQRCLDGLGGTLLRGAQVSDLRQRMNA